MVGGAGGLDLLHARVGEPGIQAAAVAGGGAPGDVALLDEPVDQARAAAATEQDPVGDLGHTHAVLGRVVEEHQHLVGRQRQTVRGVHLRVELSGQERVGLEQAAPGGELLLGQGCGGRVDGWHGLQRLTGQRRAGAGRPKRRDVTKTA